MAAGQQIAASSGNKKQGQLIDAQIEEARSRTMLNNANTKRALVGPQPNLGGPSVLTSRPEAFDRTAEGGPRPVVVEPGRDVPATQQVTIGNRTGRGLNPDAFEVGISELIAGMLQYGPQWLFGAADDFGQSRTPQRSRNNRNLRNPQNRR